MNRNALVAGSLFVGSVLATARSLIAKTASAKPAYKSTLSKALQVTT